MLEIQGGVEDLKGMGDREGGGGRGIKVVGGGKNGER